MKKRKMGLFFIIGLLCLASGFIKDDFTTAKAKTEIRDLIIFENGEFCKEVIEHTDGSSITDGKWKNDGSWNRSKVNLKESIDLSSCENLEVTYTNVGSATWVQLGLGNTKNYGEYDFVELGRNFSSDGKEHTYIYSFKDFLTTNVSCSWGKTHADTFLNGAAIDSFSIKAGDVVVNISKIVAKIKVELEDNPIVTKDILNNKTFYSDVLSGSMSLSTFEDGIWKNDKSYNHSRIGFKDSLDLSWYETIEFTYTATGTWNTNPEVGIGNYLTTGEYHFVAIPQTVIINDSNEQILTIKISDYLLNNISCTWGKTHEGTKIDITKFNGFSFKFGSTEISISKIVAKSEFLGFVERVENFQLCKAETSDIQTLLNEYQRLYGLNSNIATYQIDDNTTLAERINYMQFIYNSKMSQSASEAPYNSIVVSNRKDVIMILVVTMVGLLSITSYYFIMKSRRVAK